MLFGGPMRRSALASSGPDVPHLRKTIKAVIEACEPRILLSITPGPNPFSPFTTFIDGTVYVDNNNNGIVDGADAPSPNQTVFLDQIFLNHDQGAVAEAATSAGVNPVNVLPAGEYELPPGMENPITRATPAAAPFFPIGSYRVRVALARALPLRQQARRCSRMLRLTTIPSPTTMQIS